VRWDQRPLGHSCAAEAESIARGSGNGTTPVLVARLQGANPFFTNSRKIGKTLLRTDLIAKRTATRCDALWTMVCDSSAMLHSTRVMAMSALPYLWSVSQPRSAARRHSREKTRRRRSRVPRRSTPARCDGRYREAQVDAIHEVDHRRPAAGTISASSPVSVAIPTAYRTCGGGRTLQSKTFGS
jgi:hypothetical protein